MKVFSFLSESYPPQSPGLLECLRGLDGGVKDDILAKGSKFP